MEKDRTPNTREIYDNVISLNRILNIRIRNIVEGAVLCFIVCYLICQVNFVTSVKVLFCIIFGGVAFAFSCAGIRNLSLSEYILDKIRFKTRRKVYHLRQIQDVKKPVFTSNRNGENLTLAESVYYGIKDAKRDVERGGTFTAQDLGKLVSKILQKD